MSYFIIHHNDADGIAAAAVCLYAFGIDTPTHETNYGQEPPDIPYDADVYIVDFCYPPDELNKLAARCKSIVVIDHHKTAAAAIAEAPTMRDNITTYFDMDESGASFAYKKLISNSENDIPQVIQSVKDWDLWRFEIFGSREVHEGLMLEEQTPRHYYDMIFQTDVSWWERLFDNGTIALRHKLAIVDHMVAKAQLGVFAGHPAAFVNSPTFISDLGHALAKKADDSPSSLAAKAGGIGVVFSTPDMNTVIVSLRSLPDGPDVSVLAKLRGGGGHEHAAGFRTTLNSIDEFWL